MNAPQKPNQKPELSRRAFVAGTGALIVSFSIMSELAAQDAPAPAAAAPPART